MDPKTFDAVIQSLGHVTSRRPLLTISLAMVVGVVGPAALRDDADARNKRKRRRRRRNRNNDTPPGPCGTGQKDCFGECIPVDACCSDEDCSGDLTCRNGSCGCASTQFRCGDVCNTYDQCCTDDDCPGSQFCGSGQCWCGQPDEITCDTECCARDDGEICSVHFQVYACKQEVCPPVDICHLGFEPFSFCAYYANEEDPSEGEICACAASVDPEPQAVCIDVLRMGGAQACRDGCDSSADCDAGEVCISSTAAGSCGCANNFCVPRCPLDLDDPNVQRGGQMTSAQVRDALVRFADHRS